MSILDIIYFNKIIILLVNYKTKCITNTCTEKRTSAKYSHAQLKIIYVILKAVYQFSALKITFLYTDCTLNILGLVRT